MPYKSAHHALICCFVDHSRPGHSGWQDLYDPKTRQDVKLDLRDEEIQATRLVSSLHGMEEIAGEAALVWKHLLRMSDMRAAVLILRTCPPLIEVKSIPGAKAPHPMYAACVKLLADESAGVVSGLSKYHARRDAIRRATGAKINVGITADRCEVSRDTIERLNGKMKAWLGPTEAQAWREIEDRLQTAGLLECVEA